MMITRDRLLEVTFYERDTGLFTRRIKTGRKGNVGDVLGTINAAGYCVIGIDGRVYYAHRLAWLYMTGNDAPQIDHADGSKSNNSWINLRPATHSQNVFNSKLASNSSSWLKGVSWHKDARKWSAQFNHKGKKYHLGLFYSPEDAHAAYLSAVRSIEPNFARAS